LTIGIVLLAMIALFVGLRLYAVLGQRTGHEQQPVTRPDAVPGVAQAPAAADAPAPTPEQSGMVFDAGAATGIRAIIAADPDFDVARFMDGAQAAYGMILEAYWKGDREELAHLVGPEVLSSFESAIAERETAGHVLNNRLVNIDRATIDSARLDGKAAEIEVRFVAYVAAITRDADGHVVAGSLEDAVETNDIWLFRRDLKSRDPNWLLVETDEVG
jgi:predicted lipid-binding transport protein (Tim44 family)